MKFKEYLNQLVGAAHHAFHQSIIQSESNRKRHWTKKDGVLRPKQTKRMLNGREVEIPEHTQHDQHSFPLVKMELETETNLSIGKNGLETHVTKGMFRKHTHMKIKLKFKMVDPPEGVHAVNDGVNERLKDKTN